MYWSGVGSGSSGSCPLNDVVVTDLTLTSNPTGIQWKQGWQVVFKNINLEDLAEDVADAAGATTDDGVEVPLLTIDQRRLNSEYDNLAVRSVVVEVIDDDEAGVVITQIDNNEYPADSTHVDAGQSTRDTFTYTGTANDPNFSLTYPTASPDTVEIVIDGKIYREFDVTQVLSGLDVVGTNVQIFLQNQEDFFGFSDPFADLFQSVDEIHRDVFLWLYKYFVS